MSAYQDALAARGPRGPYRGRLDRAPCAGRRKKAGGSLEPRDRTCNEPQRGGGAGGGGSCPAHGTDGSAGSCRYVRPGRHHNRPQRTDLLHGLLRRHERRDRAAGAPHSRRGPREDEEGYRPTSRRYDEGSAWISLDFLDVIVHVFTDEARDYYRLESLWCAAPQETTGSFVKFPDA